MKIIKEGKIPVLSKQITCDYCKMVLEVEDNDAKHTDYIAVVRDGLPERYVRCPMCKKPIYFSFCD